MATLKVELGKPKKDGSVKVSIILCHASGRKRIPTNIILTSDDLTRVREYRQQEETSY